MGTPLTGLEIKDTYTGLIKTTDNGAISATAKYLSDGLGNDSSFALSTDNIGIGTIAPLGILHLKKTAAATRLAIDGDAAQNKLISYRTAGVQRFGLYVNNTAESGANAGSNFAVRAYADAGTLLTTALFIQRSTGNVGIGNNLTPTSTLDVTGTLAVSGNATFDTDTLFVDAANNRVGIGTAAPTVKLQVRVAADTNIALNDDGGVARISCFNDAVTTTLPIIIQGDNIRFSPLGTERGRFTSNGLSFNGDTAAANALDDYEEGTFTPTTSTTGYTISTATGRYTKIGRQVTIQGIVNFSAVNVLSNSEVTLLGNPFTPNSVYTGLCREGSTLGAAYVASVTGGAIIINSMDGVTTASQRTIRISEDYAFTITYFV
jgi:hypothetical protein